MAADELVTEVDATPDAVWALVGDFAAGERYIEGIEAFRIEGDDRVLTMFGLEIRERLIDRDEVARTITYSVVEGAPFESHRASLKVEPSSAGTKVTYRFEVTPDEMLPILVDTYSKALDSLKAQFS